MTPVQAIGTLPEREMNKTEMAYQAELELRRRVGEVIWYGFEVLKFRLAKDTFYTPDFIVMLADGRLEVHEVKGFWREDARAKIKIAAALFPMKFVAVTRSGQGWSFEEF